MRRLAATNAWTPQGLFKVLGLTVLLVGLLSINYIGLGLSTAASQTPVQLLLVALCDTLVLSYFVVSSRRTGWKEWGAVFAVLYGMVYVLTAIESVYLGNLLSARTVLTLLANGAVTSSVFAGALVWAFRGRAEGAPNARLHMGLGEWAWKIIAAAAVYLGLFILFGFAVYIPIAKALDPVSLAQEQTAASMAAGLVFPIELLRGALWALLAVPAILVLPFGWKKTAVMVGLLMAVPLSITLFLTTSMTAGLQVAHFVELFGENMVFGLALLWLMHLRSRLPGRAE